MSEPSPDLAILRLYELRLLRCTFLSPPPPSDPEQPSDQTSPTHPLSPLISALLTSIESGRYLEALTSADANRLVFKLTDSDSLGDHDADRVYSELLRRVESFICEEAEDNGKDQAYRVVVVLCIAVAALLAFTQSNLTGPLEGLPRCPLPLEVPLCDEWDNWARNQLMAAGSDLLGKVYNIQDFQNLVVDTDLETLYHAVSGKACITVCESYPLIKGTNANQQHFRQFQIGLPSNPK